MSKKDEVFYQFRNPNPRPTDEAQDLPLLNQEEEFDLLKDILDLIRVHEGFSKQEGSKEENREINIMRSLLVAMTETNDRTKPVADALEYRASKEHYYFRVSCLRNVKRRESDQGLSASSYRRRTKFGHRNNRASPRRPVVKSKVIRKDCYYECLSKYKSILMIMQSNFFYDN